MLVSTAAALSQRRGDFLSFTNGLRVNLATHEALIFLPEKKLQGAPSSLFYFEKGQLLEKVFRGEGGLDISALVFEDQGSFYSVLADARLIRSLLFRLYYLQGRGLSKTAITAATVPPFVGPTQLTAPIERIAPIAQSSGCGTLK